MSVCFGVTEQFGLPGFFFFFSLRPVRVKRESRESLTLVHLTDCPPPCLARHVLHKMTLPRLGRRGREEIARPNNGREQLAPKFEWNPCKAAARNSENSERPQPSQGARSGYEDRGTPVWARLLDQPASGATGCMCPQVTQPQLFPWALEWTGYPSVVMRFLQARHPISFPSRASSGKTPSK